MAFHMNSPFLNGKKKSTFGGTPDSTREEQIREEATDQLYNEGKITESNNAGNRKINKRVRKNKRKEIKSIKKS